jgi:hypothetical protein
MIYIPTLVSIKGGVNAQWKEVFVSDLLINVILVGVFGVIHIKEVTQANLVI